MNSHFTFKAQFKANSTFLLISFASLLLLPSSGETKELVTKQELKYLSKITSQRQKYFPRSQKTFKLKNGLEVLIIQDPREKMASAALDVHAGMYSDPTEFQGLAHYLEHMLFLGTKKYPAPGEYMDFVSKHSGYTNAYTTKEHTNYQFQVAPSAFPEALDRFAQFFVHPLFDKSYVEKELENIESEYKKNLDNNAWRSAHILSILANPEHPQSRFFQGNRESLGKIPYSAMVSFFKKNYTAERMKLALISPLPPATVERSVRALFKEIPRSKLPMNDRLTQPIYSKSDLPRKIEMKAVGDQDALTLAFPVPPSEDYRYTKPYNALITFLTRSGTGAFKTILEERGWITGISAGLEVDTLNESVFAIHLSIPKQRRGDWKELCSFIFGSINFLKEKGFSEAYFKELQTRAELEFEFSSPAGGLHHASELAQQMHYQSPLLIDAETASWIRYSDSTFHEILSSLSPENVQVLRVRPDLKGNRFEKKYNIDYTVDKLDSDLVAAWKVAKPDSKISYPEPNPYLPKNMRLMGQPQTSPQLFKSDPHQNLWVQVDHSFQLPKAVLTYDVISSVPKTPRDQAMAYLYQGSVAKSHRQWKALTSEAGMGCSIVVTTTGFDFTFHGYSDRLKDFAADFVSHLSDIDISDAEFEALKNEQIRAIENERFGDPYLLSLDRAGKLTDPVLFLSDEILPELKKISLSDVKKFAQSPFSKAYIRGFGFGNVQASWIEDISEKITAKFNVQNLEPSSRPRRQKIHLPAGKAFSFWDQANGKNNAWLLAYQFGKSTPELDVALQVGQGILSNPFFQEMRTQRGLGYIAHAMASADAITGAFGFLLQSDHSFADMIPPVEEWIQHSVVQMRKLPEAEFQNIKATLLETLKKKPSTFEEKFGEVNSALFLRNGDLKWKEKRIHALENLTKAQVAEIFTKAFDPKNHSKVSVFVAGTGGGKLDPKSKLSRPGEEEIRNLQEFKSKSERYTLEY